MQYRTLRNPQRSRPVSPKVLGVPGLCLCMLLLPTILLPDGGSSAGIAAGFPDLGDPVIYEVTEIDGKLVRLLGTDAADEVRVAAGERLAGGAELRTGWFSSADLAVPRAEARFHLRSRTHARLGSNRPGVLLILEKGRLRALFDELGDLLDDDDDAEEPERRIETPSAILAVRGTEYGVAVGGDGATTLVVFEGVVEVFGLPGAVGPEGPEGPPVRVRAGHAIHMRRGQPPGPPWPHGLTRRGWDRGGMPPMGPPTSSPGRHQGGQPGEATQQGPPEGSPGQQQGPPPTAPGQQGPPESNPGQATRSGPPPDSPGQSLQQGPPPGGPGPQAPPSDPPGQPSPKAPTGPPPDSARPSGA